MSVLTTLNHLDDQVTAQALVNFALLLAKGDANKYTQVIEDLYLDNGLKPPDFSRYLEQSKLEVTVEPFENDISFMTELERYQQNGYPQTAFNEEYYALCTHDTTEFEDWFDYDVSAESMLNDTIHLVDEEEHIQSTMSQEDDNEQNKHLIDSHILNEILPTDASQGSNSSPCVQSSNCISECDLTAFDLPWISLTSETELQTKLKDLTVDPGIPGRRWSVPKSTVADWRKIYVKQ